MPTYNRARYLGDAIRSVLSQTLADLELIVVDDGSADATPELVRAIADPRLRYVRIDHSGISAALNAGMRSARGNFVARLDSDDVWLPDALAVLVEVLEAQPEIGVAYAQGQAMDAQGNLIDHIQGMRPRFPDDTLRSMVFDDCTCNVALMARRECFERAGCYDETLTANEDWDMWLRVARHYRFCFVDRVLVRIRWHEDNFTKMTAPHFREVLRQRAVPLDKLFSDPELPAAVRSMQSVAYANVYQFCCLRSFEAREFRMAAREFLRVIRISRRPLLSAMRIVWYATFPVIRRYALGRRAMKLVGSLGQSLGVDGV